MQNIDQAFRIAQNKPISEWNSDDCFSYLFGLQKEGIKFGLDNIQNLLARLENPHKKLRIIHVAGTNGKGSTSAMLASVLSENNFSVGLYTSPHLVHFSERIRINGIPVSEPFLLSQIKRVARVIEEFPVGTGYPTYFEFGTALAFCCFAEQGVDYSVIETGMGGRLDATNVVDPILSVITNIGLEHQEYLGDDLVSIAGEKAGIIKEGVPVLTGERDKDVLSVFKKVCDERETTLFHADNFFEIIGCSSGLWGQEFLLRSDGKSAEGRYRIPLLGEFQLENARLVLAAVSLLRESGVCVEESAVSNGLLRTSWPGRMQVLSEDPIVIADGAHNIDAAERFAKAVKLIIPEKRNILVFGALGDKDIEGIMSFLFPCAEEVFVSAPEIDRSAPLEHVYSRAKELFPNMPVSCFPTLTEAFATAVEKQKDKKDGAVIVSGSLYTVGEILACKEKVFSDANICSIVD